MDCGKDDFRLKESDFLHKTFTDYGVPHEYLAQSGAHNVAYGQAHVEEYQTGPGLGETAERLPLFADHFKCDIIFEIR